VYCSSKSLRPNVKSLYQGELRLNENAFKRNLGKGNTWFVCAQNDLFADEVNNDFISRVFSHITKFPDNEYLFQSKNTQKMYEWAAPGDAYIYGTTVESDLFAHISSEAPPIFQRINGLRKIKAEMGCKIFITIEPIMQFDLEIFPKILSKASPDWIWIGADSKRHHLPEPSKEKILTLIEELKKFTEVRLKSNLDRLLK
jgi:protein gp37